MEFLNPGRPVSRAEIADIEVALRLRLPVPLIWQYLQSNGGEPDPYVYEDNNLDTVVAAFLPIVSANASRTARDVYTGLVLEKKIVPQQYFPFAVDGGGDYFFVDCSTEDGEVSFFSADDHSLLPLLLGVQHFWQALKPE
jgi:hypothetical protein